VRSARFDGCAAESALHYEVLNQAFAAAMFLSLRISADIMRAFPLGYVDAGFCAALEVRSAELVLRVTVAMIPAVGSLLRRAVGAAILFVSLCVPIHNALAQGGLPIPLEEQMRLFNSLPQAQQQQLIRELQRSLPPAQRDTLVNMLQGQGRAGAPAPQDLQLDNESAEALNEALRQQQSQTQGRESQKPKFEPRDTLVLEIKQKKDDPPPPVARTPEQQRRLDDFKERLEKGNPYQLDRAGQLMLPGVAGISLAGLNVDEATVRVQNEPALRPFEIIITRLPLQATGTEALEPFGYDLFKRARNAFAPETVIPAPSDYVIGPGDTINVQLFGTENNEYFQEVSREGTISFPELGPITVSGLTFADVRELLTQRVNQQMIGVRASITLGELRSMRIFVLGDVERPGSYAVSGLTTVTNALFAGGGIKTIGSLRNIALRRNGTTIGTLDLYDLLLRGDTSGDARLQPGDAIFVPPVGATVSVEGEVRRPAIYELKGERSVGEIVALAGGLNPNANRTAVKLERVVANRGTTVEDVDVTATGAQTAVRDGDTVRVQRNLEQLERSVRLQGNVFQPGLFQWSRGMRLTDVLSSPELVKPKSDLGYVLIRREPAPNIAVQVISADLREAWLRPTSESNVALEPRDTIYVFNLDNGREQYLEPIIEDLEAQAATNTALPIVRITGQVRAPGEYPLETGMRVSDLLRAGGGLSEAAYGNSAELTRYAVVNGEYRETALMTVDLAALLRGDSAADLPLTPYDFLNVKEVSRWRGEESVTLSGEVTFPGTYPIRRGETLSSVLARAGGLTDLAFPEGSKFTRLEDAARERENLEVLARRVERDLAAISVTEPNASETIQTGQSLVTQLRTTVATGRVVIRLEELLAGETSADLVLKNGDQLVVPDRQQEVTVLGEVQYATSHLFERGLSREEYIAKSGGMTQRADKKRIYVVRANGEVVAESGSRWFRRGSTTDMHAGDSIVVPLDVDQPIARWSAITQIIYNLALGAAAVASF
jgi:protein involved in polysaccharide export with SLBB domain